jgi:hypothetical protein
MANPQRGEVSFSVGTDDFTLRWDVNAMCHLEGTTGRGVNSIAREMAQWAPPMDAKGKQLPETPEQALQRADRVRMSLVRAVFWAMLRDRHPDVDIAKAGDMIGEIGGLGAAMDLIGQAFERGAAPETKGSRPPSQKAASPTGTAS